MPEICPTITATNPHTYRDQVELVSRFASRIHFDFSDGEFAPTKLVSLIQAWLPEGITADLHLMFTKPENQIETAISMHPNTVIVHAEAEGNIIGLLRELHSVEIQAGVALLANSQPEDYANEIAAADHVLIFSGKLGYHGGTADLSLLDKAKRIKAINPNVELGWDGGITDENVTALVDAGITALNVGGFIHKAESPDDAYAILKAKIGD